MAGYRVSGSGLRLGSHEFYSGASGSCFPHHESICETQSMPLFTCQAVLFDLDGVLVDSTPCVTRVWSAWATGHGLETDHVVRVAHGKKAIETVRAVAPHLDAGREFRIVEQMELEDTDGLRVLPGAAALLAALPPSRFTIVTSGTRRLALKRLHVTGLAAPAGIITADEVDRGKPDPEPYLKGAAAVNKLATECLVFEDAPSGIRSARAAGACVIGIPTTYNADELSAADLIIPSLASVEFKGLDTAGRLQLQIEPGSQTQAR